MDEQKNAPEQREKKLSRTTLTFYIVALFSVAIALILISYVAQARSAKQLDTLNDKLTEQQTVAQGATQKMEALQQQLDEQQKILEELAAGLDTDSAGLPAAVEDLVEERDAYALLARIHAQLLAENTEEAAAAFDELVQTYGEDRLLGNSEDGFGADINKLFEAAKKQLSAQSSAGMHTEE